MARFDIMPWISAHGGTETVRIGSMTASEVFDVGEPIMIVDAGTLTEPADNDTQWLLSTMDVALEAGIACYGPAGGSETNDNAAAINPQTGIAFTTADEISYWPINEGTLFITSNVFAAGASSTGVVAPLLTDIGEAYQIAYGSFGTPDTGWGVEKTAGVSGVDVQAMIVNVLDTNKAPIRRTGLAGVHIVFTLNAVLAAA